MFGKVPITLRVMFSSRHHAERDEYFKVPITLRGISNMLLILDCFGEPRNPRGPLKHQFGGLRVPRCMDWRMDSKACLASTQLGKSSVTRSKNGKPFAGSPQASHIIPVLSNKSTSSGLRANAFW